MGEEGRAVALYRDLAEARDDPDAKAELAEIYLGQGREEEAEALLEEALDLSPDQWHALYLRSVILNHSKNREGARRVLERVVGLRPEFARAHHDLGVLYSHEGRTAEAIAAYRKALALAPNALSENGLGAVFARAGELALAASHFEKAIALQPDYAPAYENLAGAYQALGQEDAARAVRAKLRALRNP
jgi:Flp pilus assembly protein TadD